MNASPADRSGNSRPIDPWVGITLSDIPVAARLVDATGAVVWQTPGADERSVAAPSRIRAFDPTGTALNLCFDSGMADEETRSIRSVAEREGEHRARNIVALSLAIANQSLGSLLDDPVVKRFLDRLRSLDAVARVGCEVEGDRCKLGVIARQVVKRFDDPSHRQIYLNGPPVVLPARWAHLVAIVLHELGANAIRHGALRQRDGQVQLRWSVAPGVNRGTCVLRLSWRETGGPPIRATGPRGFGSRVLRDIGTVSRRCSAVFDLLPTGLDYRLSIELEDRDVSRG